MRGIYLQLKTVLQCKEYFTLKISVAAFLVLNFHFSLTLALKFHRFFLVQYKQQANPVFIRAYSELYSTRTTRIHFLRYKWPRPLFRPKTNQVTIHVVKGQIHLVR